jgi:acetylornithine deacetylase/succinyl-diaminopimelate desuccinylase-like protein
MGAGEIGRQMMRIVSHLVAIALLGSMPAMTATTSTEKLSPDRHRAAHDMFERLVNIPTVFGRGTVPTLANYLANQYRAAGIPADDVRVVTYDSTDQVANLTEKTAALIVRWRAPGTASAKPIMLMGHMDVVEARREDSTTDPFMLTERDGYYYGRGTYDMKSGLVGISQAIFDLKAAGFRPTRDIVVFLTGDEETNGIGADKGATEWKKYLDAEYGLNADGEGGAFHPDGRPSGFRMQTSEKTFAGYTLTVRNRGGHSSKPRKDNAIYSLAHAIDNIEAHRFEPMLSETTRAYFTERQKQEAGALGNAMRAWLANPADGVAADAVEASESEVGLTRTRCVPTRLFAGHADNALPQLATAMINCRIFPGIDPHEVQKDLTRIVGDPEVVVSRNDDYTASLSSPLRPDVMAAFAKAVHTLHPGASISPEMSTIASDARPFRVAGIPIYGADGIWIVVPADLRAHGKDERLPVKALDDNVMHWKILLTELAGK